MATVKLKSGRCSGSVIALYLIKASLKQDTLHLQKELEANAFLVSASETEDVSATPPGARLEQCYRNVLSHSSSVLKL